VRDLMRRRMRIAIDGDNFHTQALRGDGNFLPELTATEQHNFGSAG